MSEPNLEDYRSYGEHKPPFSYAALICMAMGANSNKMTLSAIYNWIKDNFLYYRNADPSWQVRYNLNLTKLMETGIKHDATNYLWQWIL